MLYLLKSIRGKNILLFLPKNYIVNLQRRSDKMKDFDDVYTLQQIINLLPIKSIL